VLEDSGSNLYELKAFDILKGFWASTAQKGFVSKIKLVLLCEMRLLDFGNCG
jgi:hypothetical protein